MSTSQRWIRWPHRADGSRPGLAFGGDYNPEQWPEEVWLEDVRLMRDAGVNLVNVGVFSWALLEQKEGVFDFGWLDRVLDLLDENGVAVDLATSTASPPAWLVTAHPEILPVDEKGVVLSFGGRQSWCSSSPVFRDHSLRLVETVAARYAQHPALALWHISNELGCHNSRCYCDVSAGAFRDWLMHRYGTLQGLNAAWGTAFWSQNYSDWAQVQPPRVAASYPNPTQQLDYARFSSDALLEQLVAEGDVLRRITPEVPVTTNFMIMGATKNMDFFGWGQHVDVVSNDHYLREGDPEPEIELAFSADLVRGAAGGRPWMQMEQSTGAVNWGQVNRAKRSGELRRNSLTQVARGADAISYFQWRASRAGAEKFHSAMLPHAGADTNVFRDVCRLGADLQSLSEIAGSLVEAEIALLFDWPSWWASELDSHPSQLFSYREAALKQYRALWRQGLTVNVLPITTDLQNYKVLVVPGLYLVDDTTAEKVTNFAESGGTVVITYFSGIVDQNDHIRLGGYPGAFRDLLGIRVQEFCPLRPDETVVLDDDHTAGTWAEDVQTLSADVVSAFADGPYAGGAAITKRNLPGGGSAWYLGTDLHDGSLATFWRAVCDNASIPRNHSATGSLEITRRSHPDGRTYLFLINHGREDQMVKTTGTDLLVGRHYGAQDEITVPAGDVVVLRQ